MDKRDNKKWYFVIVIFGIIFTFFGGTLSYWQWTTNESQRTNVALTITEEFRCDADGGGNISSGEKYLVPTDCTNPDYAIQRTITVKPTLFTEGINVNFQLQLKINQIDTGLRNSKNFKYALTTNPNSCTQGVVEEGTFYGLSANKTVDIFRNIYTSTLTENYYLYVWLDKEETSTATMDQNFSLSLTGSCANDPDVEPQKPELDPGMIPVTISNTGVVTTISEDDEDWYDYSNKEWANVVLVNSSSRNNYLNTSGKTVSESDILAYYVWIPRYKYRIRNNFSCSELENPSTDANPECYKYSMTDSEKNSLIYLWQQLLISEIGIEYTIEQATIDVDNLLNNGSVYLDSLDLSISFSEVEMIYNEMSDTPLTYSSSFNSSNIVTGTIPIDISFETRIAQLNNGDAVKTYRTHPAFIWDGQTVGGIWVGKFKTSVNTTSLCYTSESSSNCNNVNQEPRILPNVKSLRYQTVSSQFQTSLKFAGGILENGNVTFNGSDTYGLTINSDSHMMKNSEWGAVAYLSHSKYGINQEIYINNSESFYTGRSGGDVGGKTDTSEYGTYSWTGQIMNSDGAYGSVTDSTLGTKASTTGNVTGVYDMSGGAWEYVMGVLSDTNGNPRSGGGSSWNSGFNGTVYDSGADNSYTSGIAFPNSKYYDLYLQSQFNGDYETNMQMCTLETCGGHALNETANWYSDYAYFVGSGGPWFKRGGGWDDDVGAGAFLVSTTMGTTAAAIRGAQCLFGEMERSDLLFYGGALSI